MPRSRRNNQLLTFFFAVFAFTWTAWAISTKLPDTGEVLPIARSIIFLLGVFAPAICAIVITARAVGRPGVSELVRGIARWHVPAAWYFFAAAYIAFVKLMVALLHRVATGVWPRFGDTPWVVMLLALFVSTWVQAGEELGWRAYALPRMAMRLGLGPASLLLGAVWATWHLPLFFVPSLDTYGQSFPIYLLQVTAISVTMAWLFWRTGGSLLLVMLMHAAVNNTKDIVPSAAPEPSNPFALNHSLVAWLTLALLWLGAAYFLIDMRGADLAETIQRGERERS